MTNGNESKNQIHVRDWKPMQKGASLQGFLTLTFRSGLVIHNCTYHRREDGARWVGLPSRQYTKQDGSTSWVPIVEFVDKEAYTKFQNLAKNAIDRYFTEHPAQNEEPGKGQRVVAANRLADSTMITDDDLNF